MNIKRFFDQYDTEEKCLRVICDIRKIACCGKMYFLRERPVLVCGKCLKHKSIKKDTIFENSATPLTYWFYAIYRLSTQRCGLSAKQLQREIGVTYKCAWRMLHKIRETMKEEFTLGGEVEVDETYIGGINKMRAEYYYQYDPGRKNVVFGIAERGGRVRAFHLPNVGTKAIMDRLLPNIEKGSHIYSDEFATYKLLPKMGQGYKHAFVTHKYKFVEGKAHTQNLESFWSQLKRGIRVYSGVSSQHLQKYIDEFQWRQNHRGESLLEHVIAA